MLLTYLANNWKYSDAPEGQRPFEKVIGLSKYGFGTSVGIGIYDCILLSQTQTFWGAANCMSYWVIPITAMCATFASVAYTATKIRGKDGYANYVLASIATGGVFHHWQKKGLITYYFTIMLMACAAGKKFADLNGLKVITLDFKATPQYTTFPIDMTLTKDPRGPRPWE
ncbi:uncharacterized protein ND-B14.7 isoform X2 [Linepithema humile]|nr:PREDICTED: uncharacterized protein LOC105678757 [Linepithema humile]XP_012233770.1 PREDICTED: uncharacterized protein LOC105678757 [Linepithema humile]XP_012233771.1 PREDICTED: uncharacterized protein LOC105678757 [Linepithema humile]